MGVRHFAVMDPSPTHTRRASKFWPLWRSGLLRGWSRWLLVRRHLPVVT